MPFFLVVNVTPEAPYAVPARKVYVAHIVCTAIRLTCNLGQRARCSSNPRWIQSARSSP